MRLLSLLQSFNPHWEGRDPAEWAWPHRRVFTRLAKILVGVSAPAPDTGA